MANPFTDHPNTVGETYLQHARFAAGFGFRMIVGGVACLAHAVFPFLCVRTGSKAIRGLHADLEASAARAASPATHGGARPVPAGQD